jgi:energy-coupling factor transporter ATP-binding protein EcfA2
MTQPILLRCEHLTVRYPDHATPALEDLCFEVGEAERVALLGLNGSGKTTILSAIVGLVPHQGVVRVLGRQLGPDTLDSIRASVGFLFSTPEDQLLFPRVLDDVAFSLVSRGVPLDTARDEAIAALQELDVAALADRSPYQLSRGQRLRVALAGTLVTRPPLLLLDEPTSGLDPVGRRTLARQLGALGPTMLVATHELEWASRFCTRYLLIDAGRIVADGNDFSRLSL